MKKPRDKKSFSAALKELKAEAKDVNKQIVSAMKPLLKKASMIRKKANALYDIGDTPEIDMSYDNEFDLRDLCEFYCCFQIIGNELLLREI